MAKDTSARSNTKHDFTTTIVANVEQVVGDGDEADRRKVFKAIQVLDVTCLKLQVMILFIEQIINIYWVLYS